MFRTTKSLVVGSRGPNENTHVWRMHFQNGKVTNKWINHHIEPSIGCQGPSILFRDIFGHEGTTKLIIFMFKFHIIQEPTLGPYKLDHHNTIVRIITLHFNSCANMTIENVLGQKSRKGFVMDHDHIKWII
ncbi:hypothetical protein TNIN_47501 [Trichonephila inaurata madagascariensis]|uniref:Uncharacterized protein n=1 Tax=Trichonephila inaurata madagascariensis TaxID=2747483 RepID=A0A8X6Y822_9ARAC|nr:hypothetical protein TNIN_47501 [Trichonephila inaurata madagascariensis]